ncbi:hypothetical protein Pyrfu_0347 [Pyrolobus fumarii 1A]|uniref:Yip1 domain-containing protein n=1 Tax=Pyrolobus fumarii (strain DSM 11204 / 1A) TaxID=694429 RepID=G0EFP8_PYRF1|nr:hypothetical protein [Pyrolobus fumarii]AEM38219.1 hypothetical protein Pyrfu_0347 [Pyrolobus fumarii 1A]
MLGAARVAEALSWPARVFSIALKPLGLETLAPFLYALLLATIFYMGARLVRREDIDRVVTSSLVALWALVLVLIGVAMVATR